ncbi:MAG: 50S ribosomal protein L4 [Candidatus Doudnabacteria bacterium]
MKLPIYNLDGRKSGKFVNLAPEIFDVAVNPVLVNQAVVAQRAKSRHPIAHTKTRSERRGGGAKPWKQKGTGRARAGSRRSPLWRKGGIVFGPRSERNFIKRINRKARRKAILMVLSNRVKMGEVVIVKELKIPEARTKQMAIFLEKFPLQSKPLILLSQKDEKVRRASRNLSSLKVLAADSLNVVDLLDRNCILMPLAAVKIIEKTYSSNVTNSAPYLLKKVGDVPLVRQAHHPRNPAIKRIPRAPSGIPKVASHEPAEFHKL